MKKFLKFILAVASVVLIVLGAIYAAKKFFGFGEEEDDFEDDFDDLFSDEDDDREYVTVELDEDDDVAEDENENN